MKLKSAPGIIFWVLTWCAVMFASAVAKETSHRNVIGFSADGKFFAFEEFGIADGIGTAYGNLFILNVAENSWVKGTPVRIAARESEEAQLREGESYAQLERRETDVVRKKLRTRVKGILNALGPWEPGTQRAHNLPWELSAPAQSVRFTHRDYIPYERKGLRLDLATKKFPADRECYDLTDHKLGFTLTLTDEKTGSHRILQSDQRIPKSRGCAMNYRIEEVLNYDPAEGATSLAVLIRYEVPGFEGNDGRLLAVTATYSADN